MSCVRVEALVEKTHGRSFNEVLRQYAVDEKLTPQEIALRLGCGQQALMRAAREAGFTLVRRLEPPK